MAQLPTLYSFRRCPYAIRARLAIKTSSVQVQLTEVSLRDKPPELLVISPKGTVPVLHLGDQVIDESLDIMLWALDKHDPGNWLTPDGSSLDDALSLIRTNDETFKRHLDHYKYADRYPEHPMEHYRQQGEIFLDELNQRLVASSYLLSMKPSLADMAILPFIRQFANVDRNWFDQAPYPKLQRWLNDLLTSKLFEAVMKKHS